MRLGLTIIVTLVFGGASVDHGWTAAPVAAVPVLVELFTAEGCSSCPPADRIFEQMLAMQPATGALIVGLGEHVDYWNRDGWKDRFSSAAFTARQQLYADRLKLDTIYTPQMVVDGEAAFVGSDVGAARQAIERAVQRRHGNIELTVDASLPDHLTAFVAIRDLPPLSSGDQPDIVVALTENHLRTDVKRGENRGRTLTHAVVVRELETVGEAIAGSQARADLRVASDWQRSELTVVAFVQERRSRRILATAGLGVKAP